MTSPKPNVTAGDSLAITEVFPQTANMGKGGCRIPGENEREIQTFTWDEVKKKCSKDEKWIVINNQVYDITRWMKKHPGGARILSHFGGQDATEVWTAMHNDKDLVSKYMKPLLLGRLEEQDIKQSDKQLAIKQDMQELREKVENQGLFKVNPWFYMAHLGHILALEVLAYYVMSTLGYNWITFLAVAVILATAQSQAGWTQHDYGHLSVFPKGWQNHLAHQFVIGHLKGVSSHWWNFRHFQHHAKPNVLAKDPDVDIAYLFVLGDKLPKWWGQKKKGFMPYNWQHDYFWIFGPPILLPVYFHVEVIYFVFKRKDWADLFWASSFFVRFFYMYGSIMGAWPAFAMYMFMRFLESHWFTFVTQMSHIPMEIDHDHSNDWLTSQTIATCNVDPSPFNDWFTGHLNFQIEHHLFPTMPRHNYIHTVPMVKELCKKHNLPYISKPLGTAFMDIVRSLKKSGELWYDSYHG